MNASSMCSNCFGFLDAEGYCKKCRRVSQPASNQKKSKVESATAELVEQTPSPASVVVSDPKFVAALNKVTFAVRSIALFIFISASTTFIGYAFVGLGSGNSITCISSNENCGNVGLVNFGWGVMAAGFLAGLAIGIRELDKSKL